MIEIWIIDQMIQIPGVRFDPPLLTEPPAAAEPVSSPAGTATTESALHQHVREAESRAFHDERVGRPAFGYEQLDRDHDDDFSQSQRAFTEIEGVTDFQQESEPRPVALSDARWAIQ